MSVSSRPWHGLLFFALLLFSIGAGAQESKTKQFLGDYLNKKRVILVFPVDSPETGGGFQSGPFLDSEFRGHRQEMLDRNVVVFFITGETTLTNLYDDNVIPFASNEMRNTYGVPRNQYAIILVGKDGTEKFRTDKRVSFPEINSTIDAMPDRKREIEYQAEHPKPLAP